MEFDNPDRPEATNLLTMYQLCTGMTRDEVLAECGAMRWGEFKPALTDAVVAHLEPIQARYADIIGEEGYLDSVLARGGRRERGGGEDGGGRQRRHGIHGTRVSVERDDGDPR